MFSPMIMLLVGGLMISTTLSKTNIDQMLIMCLLSMAGSKPWTVLLAFMAVLCFASMRIRCVFNQIFLMSGGFGMYFQ